MILDTIHSRKTEGRKQLALLLDPDRLTDRALENLAGLAEQEGVDYLFVGSSLLTHNRLEETIATVRRITKLPLVLFPGNPLQISPAADALLLLSLVSGRNPEMLIGRHVIAAPYLKESGLEVIATAYMLIESGKPTAALYMSDSHPIPADQPDIALCTAMAAEMLGMKMVYLDAGSGAEKPVSEEMIRSVRQGIALPLIVGGGIRSGEAALRACNAGADLIVVGNAAEKNAGLLAEISSAVSSC